MCYIHIGRTAFILRAHVSLILSLRPKVHVCKNYALHMCDHMQHTFFLSAHLSAYGLPKTAVYDLPTKMLFRRGAGFRLAAASALKAGSSKPEIHGEELAKNR